MRRVWFKKEMKEAILAGKKNRTTRYHQIPLGQVQAVCGSRFNAEAFAKLEILTNYGTTWGEVIRRCHRQEGFETEEEMRQFGQKVGLLKGVGYDDDHVYTHDFAVIPDSSEKEKVG